MLSVDSLSHRLPSSAQVRCLNSRKNTNTAYLVFTFASCEAEHVAPRSFRHFNDPASMKTFGTTYFELLTVPFMLLKTPAPKPQVRRSILNKM